MSDSGLSLAPPRVPSLLSSSRPPVSNLNDLRTAKPKPSAPIKSAATVRLPMSGLRMQGAVAKPKPVTSAALISDDGAPAINADGRIAGYGGGSAAAASVLQTSFSGMADMSWGDEMSKGAAEEGVATPPLSLQSSPMQLPLPSARPLHADGYGGGGHQQHDYQQRGGRNGSGGATYPPFRGASQQSHLGGPLQPGGFASSPGSQRGGSEFDVRSGGPPRGMQTGGGSVGLGLVGGGVGFGSGGPLLPLQHQVKGQGNGGHGAPSYGAAFDNKGGSGERGDVRGQGPQGQGMQRPSSQMDLDWGALRGGGAPLLSLGGAPPQPQPAFDQTQTALMADMQPLLLHAAGVARGATRTGQLARGMQRLPEAGKRQLFNASTSKFESVDVGAHAVQSRAADIDVEGSKVTEAAAGVSKQSTRAAEKSGTPSDTIALGPSSGSTSIVSRPGELKAAKQALSKRAAAAPLPPPAAPSGANVWAARRAEAHAIKTAEDDARRSAEASARAEAAAAHAEEDAPFNRSLGVSNQRGEAALEVAAEKQRSAAEAAAAQQAELEVLWEERKSERRAARAAEKAARGPRSRGAKFARTASGEVVMTHPPLGTILPESGGGSALAAMLMHASSLGEGRNSGGLNKNRGVGHLPMLGGSHGGGGDGGLHPHALLGMNLLAEVEEETASDSRGGSVGGNGDAANVAAQSAAAAASNAAASRSSSAVLQKQTSDASSASDATEPKQPHAPPPSSSVGDLQQVAQPFFEGGGVGGFGGMSTSPLMQYALSNPFGAPHLNASAPGVAADAQGMASAFYAQSQYMQQSLQWGGGAMMQGGSGPSYQLLAQMQAQQQHMAAAAGRGGGFGPPPSFASGSGPGGAFFMGGSGGSALGVTVEGSPQFSQAPIIDPASAGSSLLNPDASSWNPAAPAAPSSTAVPAAAAAEGSWAVPPTWGAQERERSEGGKSWADDELEALSAIYGDDLAVLDRAPPSFTLRVEPSLGSGGERAWVSCVLIVDLPENYPDEPPTLALTSPVGLSPAQVTELTGVLRAAVIENAGEPCVYAVAECVREWLSSRNEQPTDGSAFDDMMRRQRQRDAPPPPPSSVFSREEDPSIQHRVIVSAAEADEATRKRRDGTPVTPASFLAWRAAFEAQQLLAREEAERVAVAAAGGSGSKRGEASRVTGRQLFETGAAAASSGGATDAAGGGGEEAEDVDFAALRHAAGGEEEEGDEEGLSSGDEERLEEG